MCSRFLNFALVIIFILLFTSMGAAQPLTPLSLDIDRIFHNSPPPVLPCNATVETSTYKNRGITLSGGVMYTHVGFSEIGYNYIVAYWTGDLPFQNGISCKPEKVLPKCTNCSKTLTITFDFGVTDVNLQLDGHIIGLNTDKVFLEWEYGVNGKFEKKSVEKRGYDKIELKENNIRKIDVTVTVKQTIDGPEYRGYWGFGISKIDYCVINESQVIVKAGRGENSDAADAETACSTTAFFPLGSSFFFETVRLDKNNQRVPQTSSFSLLNPKIEPIVQDASISLFPNDIVLMFDENSNGIRRAGIKYFLAVHTGIVDLRITPPDIPPFTIKLIIEPRELGGEYNEYDELLNERAHQSGLLPQWLKGIACHESEGFKPDSYRYEPLNPDTGDYLITLRNFRTRDPYNIYTLRSSDGVVSDGVGLGAPPYPYSSKNATPQQYLKICSDRNENAAVNNVNCSPAQRRNILPSDKLVSAYEIYHLNPRQNWYGNTTNSKRTTLGEPCPCERRNPLDPTYCGDLPSTLTDRAYCSPQNANELLFTAQTPTAASYGWFHLMYADAISIWKGEGATRDKSPSHLFNPKINTQLAAIKLVRNFKRAQRRILSAYQNITGIERTLIDSLKYWNENNEYPKFVSEKIKQFPPKKYRIFQ